MCFEAFIFSVLLVESFGFCSQSDLDRKCQDVYPGSYCKSYLSPPVCLGSDILCDCPQDQGSLTDGNCQKSDLDSFCFRVNGPGSYCKTYQGVDVCFGGDQTCKCKIDESVDVPLTCPARMVIPTCSGVCNHLEYPGRGAVGELVSREVIYGAKKEEMNDFIDGTDIPNERNRPSTRVISNEICKQDRTILGRNARKTSSLLLYFGQFIDHDITLLPESTSSSEAYEIKPPHGDEVFHDGIKFARSAFERPGGKGPREFPNQVSGFLDLSNVYGSSDSRMRALRTMHSGLLQSRLNGKNAEGLPLDFMVDNSELPGGPVSLDRDDIAGLLACGDIRCNENPALTAVHTLWVRNHNRWARILARDNISWDDETLFQEARMRNIFQYQSIVLYEWLPALLGQEVGEMIEGLRKFDPNRPHQEFTAKTNLAFSTCAYRFGHSGIPESLPLAFRRDLGVTSSISLKSSFFNPEIVKQDTVIDNLLNGMRLQEHEELDHMLVDDLRNFLFENVGPRGDLAAINMQRGRDQGLPGISHFKRPCRGDCFSDLTGEILVSEKLRNLYNGDFSAVDCWVGGLSEKRFADSALGETFTFTIAEQFLRYRDSDRFWYERVLSLDPSRYGDGVVPIRMVDIMRLNSGMFLQDSHPAFYTSIFFVTEVKASMIRVMWTGYDQKFQKLLDVDGYILSVFPRGGSTRELTSETSNYKVLGLQPDSEYLIILSYRTRNFSGESSIVEIGQIIQRTSI